MNSNNIINNIINDYLHDLEILKKIDKKLDLQKIEELKKQLKTDNARKYLDSLPMAKPEIVLSEFLFKPILEHLDVEWIPEIKIDKRGWVDYIIKQKITKPVAIELKPLLKISKDKILKVCLEDIYANMKSEFNRTKKNQIINYLKASDDVDGEGVDYAILTNLDDVYYFNREAVFDFEPFYKEKFEDFIKDLLTIKDPWEVVRRKEDRIPKRDLDKEFFEDLKGWYETLQELKWKTDNPSEAIVYLINKFIFIKTLEDYGLIPFRFIQDTYKNSVEKWDTKGKKKLLKYFSEILMNGFMHTTIQNFLKNLY